MIEQINKLINLNLILLHESKTESISFKDFKDENGNHLYGSKILADLMLQKGLIEPTSKSNFHYQLTNFGKKIIEKGGWLEYCKKNTNQESEYKVSTL